MVVCGAQGIFIGRRVGWMRTPAWLWLALASSGVGRRRLGSSRCGRGVGRWSQNKGEEAGSAKARVHNANNGDATAMLWLDLARGRGSNP